MYQALFFDLDGVLLNTEELTFRIWRDYLYLKNGYIMGREQYAKICGSPPESFQELIKKELPVGTEELIQHWECQMDLLIREGRIPPVEGFDVMCNYLTHYRGKRAIVTSNGSPWVKGYEQLFCLKRYFGRIFDGTMVRRRKPWPDIYLMACNNLQAEPQKCLTIEDSTSGAQAAFRAGIPVLHMEGIASFSEEEEAQCIGKVRNLAEAVRFLKKGG